MEFLESLDDEDTGSENMDDWVEEFDEDTEVVSLFSAISFPNVSALLAHHLDTFNFDIRHLATNLYTSPDRELGLIMMINFIRDEVRKVGLDRVDAAFIASLTISLTSCVYLTNQEYMKTVLENDALIALLPEELAWFIDSDDEGEGVAMGTGVKAAAAASGAASGAGSSSDAELTNLKKKLQHYEEFVKTLTNEDDDVIIPEAARPDDYYFDGYGGIAIHETMLRDKVRTLAYREAVMANAACFKDKVVLDVGCGTGILSMIAARAGARKVVAVDQSNIVDLARKIVEKNGCNDVITIVKGRMEEVELPLQKGEVDFIISEWMGYALLFENMFASVLFARDAFLAPGGSLLPSQATIFLEAGTSIGEEDRIGYWEDVYSFDMTCLTDMLTKEAQVQLFDPDHIISPRVAVHVLELETIAAKDLEFSVPFALEIDRASRCKAFVISFDTLFANPSAPSWTQVNLPTATQTEPTHWKQTVLWLDKDNQFDVAAGALVQGQLTFTTSKANARDYIISLSFTIPGSGSGSGSGSDGGDDERSQQYNLFASS